MNPFLHPHSLVDGGVHVGTGTRVWAFAHLASGAFVGDDCNICDHVFVEGKVRVGNRVTIKCGVHLWDGLVAEDDVFIGPSAAFTNDPKPRSKRYPDEYQRILLREGCSIGANATVLGGVIVGRWAMVAAGSVVTREVPDFALVVGSPARFRAWICRCAEKLDFHELTANCTCGRSYRRQPDGTINEER